MKTAMASRRVCVNRPHLSSETRATAHGKPDNVPIAAMKDSYRRIYAAVSRIPRGRVATYGQIAEVAGLPRQARLVGYALNVLPPDTPVPWYRVVNAQGKISVRSGELGAEDLQAHLLRREGVRFAAGVISLRRYRWQPKR
jgi:methylated-DNA-protein-cysteine methyltransferase related protein